MSTTNWKERWEEKDKDGDTVVDVWEIDGQPVAYMWDATGGVKVSPEVFCLIPRKPAPVVVPWEPGVVPWEPGEVPVGTVVRRKNHNSLLLITAATNQGVFVNCILHSFSSVLEHFVLHQPGVPTEQCQPCGKVVGK